MLHYRNSSYADQEERDLEMPKNSTECFPPLFDKLLRRLKGKLGKTTEDGSLSAQEQADLVVIMCEDAIQEILLRLPVKTLIRFKLVSKAWMAIITNPNFIWNHFSIVNIIPRCTRPPPAPTPNPKPFYVIHKTGVTSISVTPETDTLQCTLHDEFIPLPFIIDRNYEFYNLFTLKCPPIVSIGLGLLCIFKFRSLRSALWNPATREFKEFPPPPRFAGRNQCKDIFGFGHTKYKDGTFSCKIGILFSLPYKGKSFLHLYSSSSNSWKFLVCEFGYKWPMYPAGVNFKGTFHLLSTPPLEDSYAFIITFDYTTELFGRMEVPQDFAQYDMFRSDLTLYADKYLCLFLCCKSNEVLKDELFFDVWIMREYGVKESWSKQGTLVFCGGKARLLNFTTDKVFLTDFDHGSILNKYWWQNHENSLALKLLLTPLWPHESILKRTESLVTI